MSRYRLIRREEVELEPALQEHSRGLTRRILIGGDTGATHTGLTLVELENGDVDTHLHSFENSFYVFSGNPVLYLDERGIKLEPDACGVIPVGVPHAWRSDERARWIEMASPRPAAPNSRRTHSFSALPPTKSRRSSTCATRGTATSSISRQRTWTWIASAPARA